MHIIRFQSLFAFFVSANIKLSKDGGGGGNRTRVRRYSTRGIYMLILFLVLIPGILKRKDSLKPISI